MIDPGFTLDLRVTPRGETGTMTAHGVTWEVLALDGTAWARGNALWAATLPAARAAALGDGWVQVSDPAAAFGWARLFVTLPTAVHDVVFGPHAGLHVSGTIRLGGRTAVELRSATDVYDVAATGTPYPLRWLDTDIPGPGGQPCGITLDRFGEPVTLAPPSPVVAKLSPTG